MVHIFVGEDDFYTSQAVKKEINKLYSDKDRFEFFKFDAYLDLLDRILEECQTFSFFCEKKIILVNRTYFLSSSKEKPSFDSKQNFEQFIAFCKQKEETVELYLVVSPSLNKSEVMNKIKDYVDIQYIENLDDDQCLSLIFNKVKKENKSIDKDAALELMNRCRIDKKKIDLLKLENNLNKLMLFTSSIKFEDVDLVVYKELEDKIFMLSENLIQRNTKQAIEIYRDLINLGNQIYNILPVLFSSFAYMARVKYLYDEHFTMNQIATILKDKSIYRVQKTLQNIKNISYKDLNRILSDLSKEEIFFKYENKEANSTMEYFICNFGKNYFNR